MKKEIWEKINGIPRYEVSSIGNIRHVGGKNLTLTKNIKDGYFQVGIWQDKKVKTLRVHRIVAQTFIKNLKRKPWINHIDNNRCNNSVSNLEWCTPQENVDHCVKQGRNRWGIEKGKLTFSKAAEIREMKKGGVTQREIGKIFSVDESLISKVIKGKIWKI